MNALSSPPLTMPHGIADEGALFFQRFADNSDDVFWLADVRAGQLLFVSKRFEHFWGIPHAQLFEEPDHWSRAIESPDAGQLPRPFFAAGPDGHDSVWEYRIRSRQGTCYWMRERRFHLRDEQGVVVRVGGIAEDITERKQAELDREALLQRERQARAQAESLALSKDEFLAVVTHELRSPLSAIRGWAHVLRGSGELNALQLKALDAIDRNTQAQARMVDDLLDSQRILSGKLELDWSQPFLSTLVNDAVEVVQPQAQAKQIHLSVDHDPAIQTVSADITRLRQALVNLLTNAVKFTPEGGTVRVETRHHAQGVSIAVKDSGIGLEPRQLPLVFQRFQQADSSNTRPQRGLGLGLSLAHQLVALHGGEIRVESAGAGQGSTFTIELPLSLTTQDVLPSMPGASPNESRDVPKEVLAGQRLMIVEDDDDGREALELILKDTGATLLSFGDAASAYDHLAYGPADEQPTALISDIAMPRENGYEFICRVRALEEQRQRPRMLALALTAFAGAEDRQRAHEAGFDAHLAKPLDSAIIIRTLLDALQPFPGASSPAEAPAWSGASRAPHCKSGSHQAL